MKILLLPPRLLAATLLLALSSPLPASNDPAQSAPTPPREKGPYNLFRPTPTAFLRDFSVDRPSESTGPYTVDAGYFISRPA